MAKDQVIPTHDHQTLTFPKGFLWGAATSALQVEGNNIQSDWWQWEQKHQPEDKRCGPACDQYHKYQEDFDLVKKLGHNSHRLSIEWSRIEPEEGKFDETEIAHYKSVLKNLKDQGIIVMLTLHHFSNPAWIAQIGGWENGQTPKYFARFVQKIVPEIKDYVDLWVTVNEPGIYIWRFYQGSNWPNAKKSFWGQIKSTLNFAKAHKKAYRVIHKLAPGRPVGIAQNVQSFDAYHKHSLLELFWVYGSDIMTNHSFYLLTRGYHDFLGINYYFHHHLNKQGGLIPKEIKAADFTKEVSDMGWEIYPQGIFSVLTDLSDHLPIYITECGIATSNDDRRIRFLMGYLQEIYHALGAGVNVKGFFYWSLLDNCELTDGFKPRFGLVEVDFKTQKRTPRPSAYIYKDIIENNGIRHELMKFLGHRVHVDEVIEIP